MIVDCVNPSSSYTLIGPDLAIFKGTELSHFLHLCGFEAKLCLPMHATAEIVIIKTYH